MRNADNICSECGGRIPPGAPVAIVHTWERTAIKGWSRRTHRQQSPSTAKRLDHWLCHDCVQANHKTENSVADTGRCENCERKIRHWDFSQPMPTACCAECRRLARNARNREHRRVTQEPIACVACGEMFTPTRSDANTCSGKCRQKLYRETRARRSVENKAERAA